MTKPKKPNFFHKLFGKLFSRKKESESSDEDPPSFDENLRMDTQDGSRGKETSYQTTGYADDEIEKRLQDRDDADWDPLSEDDEEESVDFNGEHQIFQVSDEQKKELDELDHSAERPQNAEGNDKTRSASSDRDIDLETIKNYEITDEDEEDDHTLGDYREFTPPPERKLTKVQKFMGEIKAHLNPRKFLAGLGAGIRKGKRKTGSFNALPTSMHWDHFVDTIFGPHSRPKVQYIFIVALLVCGTYSLGKISAIILKGAPQTQAPKMANSPPPPNNNLRAGINEIKQSNLFNAKMTKDEQEDSKQPKEKKPDPIDKNLVCKTSSKSSSLPIKLVNTIVLQDSVKSIASVQVRGERELKNIREGEKIKDMAEVGKINRLKMIFKNLNNGECEYVANRKYEEQQKRHQQKDIDVVSAEQGKKLMENKKDGIQNEGDKYTIKKSVRDKMLSNINQVLTQARAIQIKNPDGSYSFKMTEIVPGSIYSKLGLKNDDIIQGINGEKIKNMNELMSMFGQIKNIDHFELKIKRDGQEQTQEYNFQ